MKTITSGAELRNFLENAEFDVRLNKDKQIYAKGKLIAIYKHNHIP